MWRILAAVLTVGLPTEVVGGVANASPELVYPNGVTEGLAALAGKRAGVDIAGKLVAAALRFSPEIHRGEYTHGHFAMVHEYIHMLVATLGSAYLVVVFDGGAYPAKAGTHKKRAEKAEEYEIKAIAADAEANAKPAEAVALREAARKAWKSVLSRPALLELKEFAIEVCVKLQVPYLVSPFEADSQIAALHHWGYTQSGGCAVLNQPWLLWTESLIAGGAVGELGKSRENTKSLCVN